jgi:hypothetical protein
MRPIELIGYVDENHQLRVEVPPEIAPGPVKVIVAVEEEDPAEWGRAVLARWAEETNDPRDDIYTLEDGVPYHGSR